MTTDTPPDTETADGLRAQAAELRAAADLARAEREKTLAAAQAEAERLVTEAKQLGGQLRQAAADAERGAEQLEARAGYLARVEQLAAEIPVAERTVIDLVAEGDRLREQIEQLGVRLAELAEERRQTHTVLSAAADSGDVERVVEARTRLGAVDDVTAALERQRAGLAARLDAIGDLDSSGELGLAVDRWRRLQAEDRHLRNKLAPDRPEAAMDAARADLEAALLANWQRIQEEQQQDSKPPRPAVHIN